jgi:hypothetical protein
MQKLQMGFLSIDANMFAFNFCSRTHRRMKLQTRKHQGLDEAPDPQAYCAPDQQASKPAKFFEFLGM